MKSLGRAKKILSGGCRGVWGGSFWGGGGKRGGSRGGPRGRGGRGKSAQIRFGLPWVHPRGAGNGTDLSNY